MIQKARKASILILNKWDLVKGRTPREFGEGVRREMPFLAYAPIVVGSAEEHRGMDDLLQTCAEVANNHAMRISTDRVTDIRMDKEHQGSGARGQGSGASNTRHPTPDTRSLTAVEVLKWALWEMERRYKLFAKGQKDKEGINKVFRNIKVSIPSLSTVRVRARKGYYPANP